jgi:hypothetical protein
VLAFCYYEHLLLLACLETGKDTSTMQVEGLKTALRAPKLVLRFRALVRSCIVALQAGVCMVLTNEDMPLLFTRIVSAVVRGGSTASASDDDGSCQRPSVGPLPLTLRPPHAPTPSGPL